MSIKDFVFPIIRTDFSPKPKPEILEGLEEGHEIPDTLCMRVSTDGCRLPRWHHPKLGELVLCRGHAAEVGRGERRAPPLRRNIDYYSGARRGLVFYEDFTDPKPK